jgi:hypothetical protein
MSERQAAEQVAAAERDAKAVELRSGGASYRTIARELGIATSTAYDAVQAGLAAVRREPSQELIELEAEHLDRLRREALAVLEARHPLVQGGEVVMHAGPVLGAIRALLAVAERRAKLLGLDAPTRVDTRLSLTAAWEQASLQERDAVLDQEIREIEDELARRGHPRTPREPRQRWAPPDQAEALAEAVEAALDAAGVPEADREAAYDAVEARLRATGNGDGGPR